MLVPASRASLVTLPGELAARVGADRVAVAFDEDGLFDGVYRHAATVTGQDGYEVSDRVPDLTMPEQEAILDLARQARPVEYHDARHASGRVRDAARVQHSRPKAVRYIGGGRHR